MIHILQHVCYCSIRGICHVGKWNWIPLSNLDKPCGIHINIHIYLFIEGEGGQEGKKKKKVIYPLILRSKKKYLILIRSSLLFLALEIWHNRPSEKQLPKIQPHLNITMDGFFYLYYEIIEMHYSREPFNMYRSIFFSSTHEFNRTWYNSSQS